jgi:hypothetical protein
MRIVRSLGRALARQWMGALALTVVLSTGTAYAASSMWTGANIVDSSLTGADVQDGSLSGTDIQNGSITSGDLAPDATTGSGSAAPVLQWDAAGPFDIPAQPGGDVTLATKTFTVANDGFIDFYFSGDLTGDPGVCTSSDGFFVQAGAEIDNDGVTQGASLEDDGDGPYMYSRTPMFNLYLPAGQHTVTLIGHVYDCVSPQGSFHIGNTHFLAVPAS